MPARSLACLALALATLTACKPDRVEITPPDPVAAQAPAPDPRLVDLASALPYKLIAADRAAEVQVRLRIDGGALAGSKRPPIHVVLVMDSSGSMEGPAVAHARKAALELVDGLADGDHLAVVTFDSQSRVLVPSTVIDDRTRADARTRVEAMAARGTTDLAGGLRLGLAEASRGYLADGVNRLVLLSDGLPNDPAPIAALVDQAAGMRVAVTALGLGLEYDETLLAAMAQRTGGKFHFIEDSAQVAAVLRDEVLRLERIVARNLSLQLLPGPGVTIDGVLGHTAQATGNRGVVVGLGDLGESTQRDLVVRLRVGPHKPGASLELMDAILGFQDAVVGAGQLERRVFVGARTSDDARAVAASRDVDVERQVARALADAATLDAIALARQGQLTAAVAVIDRAEPLARGAADSLADPELRGQADELVKLRRALPSLGPAPQPMPSPNQPLAAADSQPLTTIAAPPRAPADAPSTVKRSHGRAMQRLHGR
ncbi:MAG: VWA domain-containing protein [Myxococcales bacterium]|nr:VWA domain-containing protein [Myxococcales bacterium]